LQQVPTKLGTVMECKSTLYVLQKKKKSNGVRSGEGGDQVIGPLLTVYIRGNFRSSETHPNCNVGMLRLSFLPE